MKLSALFEVAVDDDEFERREELINEKVRHMQEIGKHKFGIDFSYGAYRAFLMGGGAPDFDELNNALIDLGYNEEATSYQENEHFWRSFGISKTEMDEMIG